MDLKTLIRDNALDMGFSAVGICDASPIKEYDHLNEWLKNNYYGEMAWISKEPMSRCNPRSLLASANSVICLAFHYDNNAPKETNIARFAQGFEYHQFMRDKLKLLWKTISAFHPGGNSKICVDTSPILEKALAVKSGIGWQGKNSVVIHPLQGSYFVLGEIITDLELEPDFPIPNNCGACTKCIDACPTKAITKPGLVDARRCLSYLTIEHKGPVPKELLPYLKEGQYGCDICQEVCPYNSVGL